MPRQLRIEYAGAIYHVMNRGNHKENIFLDDDDRRKFLVTLGEACCKADWEVHAYCLMNNHFHLVIETLKPTLVDGMKWLLGVYTQRFNARHQKHGHLFAGRYKSLIVDGSDDDYLRKVCDYVHLNPARAGLLKNGALLESFPWSSFSEYLKPSSHRFPWLRVDRLLGEYGIQKDDAAGRREFFKLINSRCAEENSGEEGIDKIIRRSWKFGAKDFVERLFEQITSVPKKEIHLSPEIDETMEVKGRKLIQEKLKALNLKTDDLDALPRMDPMKIEIAQLIRTQTTLPLKWIVHELKIGSVSTLKVAFHKRKNNRYGTKLSK
ncbi:MAG: transposase [Chthoniobacterales bacterium]|nr:transposase [Chthoniobacterales bacterium]